MRRAAVGLLVAGVMLTLPAAARADGITAQCTAGGVTSGCASGHWYTSDVKVSFVLPAGSSNPQGCGDQIVATDTAGTSISCSVAVSGSQCCRLDVTIKRDATPPVATEITAQRSPDANGWYNHGVGVSVAGSDATSGIASCTSVTYSGPDSSSASVAGRCTDNAGNVSPSKTLSFQYDATPPSVSPAPARAADANGWYNHAVDVAFQGSDSVSGIDSCTSGSYSGPDNGSAGVAGTCRDKAGNTATATFSLQYDATPPAVTAATPDRQPDANGWYNHGLTVTYTGTDAASGIAACDAVAYAKPDDASASVSGRCHDNAGNASAPAPFAFKFDSTPPKLTKLAVAAQSGTVGLTWTASSDVAAVKIVRTRAGAPAPVTLYSGKRITAFTDKKVQNGSRYAYVVSALDAAGNEAIGKAKGDPSQALLTPRQSAVVHGRTTLRWRAVRKATYYNVQLWLGARKILTTWPAQPSLALPRLRPGTYSWIVWPGLGPRSKHRYGPPIGRSTFVIRG
jgi:hypothetical protein